MKKSVIIIVALACAITILLGFLGFTFAKPYIASWLGKSDGNETYSYSYSMVPTATVPAYPQDTESWVDINAIAGDLATATDTDTSSTSLTLAPIVVGSEGGSNITSIVYIDQNGNIVDPDKINNNKSTTYIENDSAFDETISPTEDNNAFGEYEINSSGVITKYLGSSTFVMMPTKVNGVTVKGIGKSCFENSSIKGVQFPATLSHIDTAAFKNCKSLENVIFINSGANVVIGNSAFEGCSSLKNINLPITSSIGKCAFQNCKSLQKLDIKKGTKEIGEWCFAYCESLTSLTIRDEKTTIKNGEVFKGHNPSLIVYCEIGSDVEFKLNELGLSTAPISS